MMMHNLHLLSGVFLLCSSTVVMAEPFNNLARRCAAQVHPNTLQAIARVESSFNPYAIGVVRGALPRQPRNHQEAVAAARMLHAQGKNFSMGLMQVNRYNLARFGLNYETVFDPCKNIQAGAAILTECFNAAGGAGQLSLQKAFSCYYSGNFRTGFRRDFPGQPSYVQKVVNAAAANNEAVTIKVPAIVSGSPVRIPSSSRAAPARSTQKMPQAASPQTPTEAPKPHPSWDVFSEL